MLALMLCALVGAVVVQVFLRLRRRRPRLAVTVLGGALLVAGCMHLAHAAPVDAGVAAAADSGGGGDLSSIATTLISAFTGHVNGWTPVVAAVLALLVWINKHEKNFITARTVSWLGPRWGGYASLGVVTLLAWLSTAIATHPSAHALWAWMLTGGFASLWYQLKKDIASST